MTESVIRVFPPNSCHTERHVLNPEPYPMISISCLSYTVPVFYLILSIRLPHQTSEHVDGNNKETEIRK